MIFKEYTYSVLLVSSSQKFSEQILKMLPDNEFGPKICAKSSEIGRASCRERVCS